jgi:gas vesicle protein
MGRAIRFLTGFLFGMSLGTLLALMWAPHTGPELRAQMEERFLLVVEEGRKAAETRRQELLKELEESSKVPAPNS